MMCAHGIYEPSHKAYVMKWKYNIYKSQLIIDQCGSFVVPKKWFI